MILDFLNLFKDLLDKDFHLLMSGSDFDLIINSLTAPCDRSKLIPTNADNVPPGHLRIGKVKDFTYEWSPLMRIDKVEKYMKLKSFW